MLKIKLARFGKKKQPHYRIVVNEARDKRDGKYVDIVGHYAPTFSPKILDVDLDKYKEWMKKGAQPTDTVLALVTRFESGNPFPEKKAQLSRKAKAKLSAEAEAANQPKEEAAPEAAEIPAEEAAPAETAEAPAEATEAPTEEASR